MQGTNPQGIYSVGAGKAYIYQIITLEHKFPSLCGHCHSRWCFQGRDQPSEFRARIWRVGVALTQGGGGQMVQVGDMWGVWQGVCGAFEGLNGRGWGGWRSAESWAARAGRRLERFSQPAALPYVN